MKGTTPTPHREDSHFGERTSVSRVTPLSKKYTRGNRVSAWEGSGNLGSLGRELDPGGVELKKNSRVTVPVRAWDCDRVMGL